MGTPEQNAEPGGTHLMDEPDIGSGGKTPAERETDEQIRQIPRRPAPAGEKVPPGQAQPAQEPGRAPG